MNAVCLFYLHALEKTAIAGFKTGESLSMLQLKAGTHEGACSWNALPGKYPNQ